MKDLIFRPSKFIIGFYCISLLCLFFYSYTQVDLGLTLTRASFITDIQKSFQYIGYFNRPLSTIFYCLIIISLFKFYGLFLYFAKRGKLSRKTLWAIIFLITAILVFSYNAFSYDLFNYIFDAKILTHYHLNPYMFKALDFPGDKMLAFMHWTHRTYPYGPTWLFLTVPVSFIGFQIFIPTFFLFKILSGLMYLGTVWGIGKIMQVIAPKKELLAVTFFALNPLVIIESLVSAHNDTAMMFLAVISILFLVKKKYLFAFAFLLISIGVKFATVFLLPLFIIFLFQKKNVVIEWSTILYIFLLTMIFALFAASIRSTFQPWYLLYLLPVAALISEANFITVPFFILSFVGLLNYIPYLYTGSWDPPIPMNLLTTNIIGVILALVVGIWLYRKSSKA